MKGDFSRNTFRPDRHYSGVRMQQGRVQLDADWNEQIDIQAHRDETVGKDLIGPSGAPSDNPGFEITPEGNNLKIGQGRYYVDGILCDNKTDVYYAEQPNMEEQPDLPRTSLPTVNGPYLAYLDVWQRHITSLEDPDIREVALGGPDTTTRTKTVWQVKLLPLANVPSDAHSLTTFSEWTDLITPPHGQLRARSEPGQPSSTLQAIEAGEGYQRLENQLYRVEIHTSGGPGEATFKWSRDNGSVVTSWTAQSLSGSVLTVGSTGRDQMLGFAPGQWVELTDDDRELWSEPGIMVQIQAAGERSLTIRPADEGRIYLTDNAAQESATSLSLSSSVARISLPTFAVRTAGSAGVPTVQLLVSNAPLILAADGEFATLESDLNELTLIDGKLIDGNTIEIAGSLPEGTSVTGTFTYREDNDGTTVQALIDAINSVFTGGATATLAPGYMPQRANFDINPKVRRWDSVKDVQVPVPTNANDWIELEDGVRIQFTSGDYRTGDFWLIPARTFDADIEWPKDGDVPTPLPPHGTAHNYCRLALLEYDGSKFALLNDYRCVFPTLTDINKLRYISGDGQEAMPGDELPQALRVGVFIGRQPLEEAKVRFEIVGGGGILREKVATNPQEGIEITLPTDPSGIAACSWELPSYYDVTPPVEQEARRTQLQVKATLVDDQDEPMDDIPVFFTAALSLAETVAYEPRGRRGVPELENETSRTSIALAATVQEGLDILDDNKINKYGPDEMEGPLEIHGGLTVLGEMIVKDVVAQPGNVELGDHDRDTITIHGRLRFAKGDTGQTYQALIVDDNLRIGAGFGSKKYVEIKTTAKDGALQFLDKDTSTLWEIRDDAGILKINEGANEQNRLTVLDGGNVGIGTTTPVEPLTIRAKGDHEGLIAFEDASGTVKWHINQDFSGRPGLNFAETGVADGRLFIEVGGNVGIGTTGPEQKLVVSDGKVGIGYNEPAQTAALAVAGSVGIGTEQPKQKLVVQGGKVGIGYNDTAQAAALAVNGKVGIGTMTPNATLHISNGKDIKRRDRFSGYLVIGSVSDRNIVMDDNEITARHADELSPLHLQADGGDLVVHGHQRVWTEFVIKESGKVGIGTRDPATKLHIASGKDVKRERIKLRDRSSGYLVIGSVSDRNIVMDDNEITARNADEVSPLHLQADGGDLVVHYHQPVEKEFVIKDSGNVGLGIKEPKQKLVISHGRVGIGYNDATQTAALAVNGNVGIGTTVPDDNLHVKGTLRIEAQDSTDHLTIQHWGRGRNRANLTLLNEAKEPGILNLQGFPSETAKRARVVIGYMNNPPQQLSVQDGAYFGGDVDIGTAKRGNSRLTVKGTFRLHDGDTGIEARDSWVTLGNPGSWASYVLGEDRHVFDANRGYVLFNNGNVGLGTRIPDEQLHVVGNCIIDGNLQVNGETAGINTALLEAKASVIQVNGRGTEAPTAGPMGKSGLAVHRGTEDAAQFVWDEQEDCWKIGTEGDLTEVATIDRLPSGVARVVEQANHGFQPGDAIRYSGDLPGYVKANSSDETTTGMFVVSQVGMNAEGEVNTDCFTLVQAGYIDGLSGLTPGEYYFVSAEHDGELTAEESPLGISNPIFYADSPTAGYVLPYRPSEPVDTSALGGVPPGYLILGEIPTAPAGYTYTGQSLRLDAAWYAKADMPTARYHLAIGVANDRIYAIGGYGSGGRLNVTEEYDPATDTWTTKAAMPTARHGLAIGVANDRIYAIGGSGSSGRLNVTEEYDPATDIWTTKAAMPTARYYLAIGVANDRIYAIGGYGSGGRLNVTEEYDPATDTWTTKAAMPTVRHFLAIGVVNDRIYAIGGSGSGGYLNVTEEYDPATDTWTTKAAMPTARGYFAIGVVNDRIYAIGGTGSGGYLNVTEEYDPATDTWTTKAAMPTVRHFLAIGVVNDRIYAIGGWYKGYLATNEALARLPFYMHRKD